MSMVMTKERLEFLPHALADHLHRLLLQQQAQADVTDHLFVLDLFSRYVLFVPLAYYFHLLRNHETATRLVDVSLCNYIVDCLGTRRQRGGSPGLTPYNSLELSGRIADHLARSLQGDPVADSIASTHRRFSRFGKRQSRLGLDEESERVFKRQRDHLCHAKSILDPVTKRQLCAEWREHLAKWLDCDLFQSVVLCAETVAGQQVSLMYGSRLSLPEDGLRQGSETFVFQGVRGSKPFRCEYSAFPFIRVRGWNHVFNTLFLSYYTETADGSGLLNYTDSMLKIAPDDQPPELVAPEFAETIIFPWLRIACGRRAVARQVQAGRPAPVALLLENQGSETATVNPFDEVLPERAHAADGSHVVHFEAQSLTPGEIRELRYDLIFDTPTDMPCRFGTRAIAARQGSLAGRVPISGSLEIGCIPSLPAEVCISRRILRWFRDGWLSVPAAEPLVMGDLVRVELSLENPGDDLDRLAYSELISPGSVSELLSCNVEGADATPKLDTLEDKTVTIGIDVAHPFVGATVLRLIYEFVTGAVEQVTILGKLVSASQHGEAPLHVRPAEADSRKQSSEGMPGMQIHVRSASQGGAPGELVLNIDVENQSRQVLRRPFLSVQLSTPGNPQAVPTQPLDPLVRPGATVPAQLAVPFHSSRLVDFSVDLEFSDCEDRRQRLPGILCRAALGRVWQPLKRLSGFYGRKEVLDELSRRWFHQQSPSPVFIYGRAGTGKMALLRHLRAARGSGPEPRLVVEEPIICYGTPLGRYYQLFDITKSLCKLAAGYSEETSDLSPEDILTSGLNTLGVGENGTDSFLRLLLLKPKEYLGARDQDSISEDLFHFFRKFCQFKLRSNSATEPLSPPAFSVILPLENAACLDRSSMKLLRSICERLRRAPIPLDFLLIDDHYPVFLEDLVHPVCLGGWTSGEFAEICELCFLYPRLSAETVEALYKHSGGNPGLAASAINYLQKNADETLQFADGVARLRNGRLPSELSSDMGQAIAQEFKDFLDKVLEKVAVPESELGNSEAESRKAKEERDLLRKLVCETVAFLNCVEGSIDRKSVLKLMGPPDQWKKREGILDLIVEYGWAVSAGSTLSPTAGLTRREMMKRQVKDVSKFHDLLLEHYQSGDLPQAVLYLSNASDEGRAKYFPVLLKSAFRELRQAHYRVAQQYFWGLTASPEQIPTHLRRLVIYGGACVEWKLGNRRGALGWCQQLPDTPEIGAATEQSFGIDGHAINAQAALLDSWERTNEEPVEIARVLEPLEPYLSLRRRLVHYWQGSPCRFLQTYFDHHLVALEQLFFAADTERFLRIYRHLNDCVESMPATFRLEYIETLWRLAEDQRSEDVIRQTTPPITSILGEQHQDPSPLQHIIQHDGLMEQTRALLNLDERPSPVWLGRVQLRRWKLDWAQRRSTAPGERSLEDWFAPLDQAIDVFRAESSLSLEADAQRAKGEALVFLLETKDKPGLREQAYQTLKAAACAYETAGLARLRATTLITAVQARLMRATDDLLRSSATELVSDLETAYSSGALTEEEKLRIHELILQLSWFSHDQDRITRYLSESDARTQVGSIAYLFRKDLAKRNLSKETPEGYLDAQQDLLGGLALLDRSRKLVREKEQVELRPLRQIKLNSHMERADLHGMLSAATLGLGYLGDCLNHVGHVLDYLAGLGPGPDPSDLGLSELKPGATTPEAVVLFYFRRCLDVWQKLNARGDTAAAPRVDFFREHLLARFGGQTSLRECLRLFSATLPPSSCASERLMLITLEAEVAAGLGDSLPVSFGEVPQLIAQIRFDEPASAARMVEEVRRILHLSLQENRDLGSVLNVLRSMLKHPRHALLAARALTSEMLHAQTLLARAELASSAQVDYLESFSNIALDLVRELAASSLDADTLDKLVRLSLMSPKFHQETLRWVQQLETNLLRKKDERHAMEALGLLCQLVAENAGSPHNASSETPSTGTDASVDDLAEARESCMKLLRRLIAESAKPRTWLSSDAKHALLFHLVEKVIPDLPEHRDIKLVTALVLHRTSTQIDPSGLKLLMDAWIPCDTEEGIHDEDEAALWLNPSHQRTRLLLAITQYQFYRDKGLELRDDDTYIWNTLLSSKSCRASIESFLSLRSVFSQMSSGYISAEEAKLLPSINSWIQLETTVWATVVVRELMPGWGSPETMTSFQIRCVEMLAAYLLPEAADGDLPFAKAYAHLQKYVSSLPKENWQEALGRSLLAKYPEATRLMGIPRAESAGFDPLANIADIGFVFIERAAAKVYKLTMDALLADVDKRLTATAPEEHEEFIRPTDLDVSALCESYERLLSSYHYAVGE